MAHAQLRDLAGSAGRRVLVALAARLGVVKRSKTVGYGFCVVEFRLVGLMGSVVHHAVAFVVESSGCVGIRGVGRSESNTQKHHDRQNLHGFLPSWRSAQDVNIIWRGHRQVLSEYRLRSSHTPPCADSLMVGHSEAVPMPCWGKIASLPPIRSRNIEMFRLASPVPRLDFHSAQMFRCDAVVTGTRLTWHISHALYRNLHIAENRVRRTQAQSRTFARNPFPCPQNPPRFTPRGGSTPPPGTTTIAASDAGSSNI